ncbi:MAG: hypothetical protein AAGU76_04570 [Sedimentibacter sp.]|uniref:hypothetical protein n=1 Tax=Sedimentibacter sp. TaxID=1960295 RepID=UPI00315931DF
MEQIENGYEKIFWGFLISMFDINLGPVNILPDFIGYFMLGTGICKIYKEFESKDLKTADSISNFLVFYSLVMPVLNYGFSNNLIGTDLNSHPVKILIDSGLSIFISSIILIMIFYIISGSIALFIKREQNSEAGQLEKIQRKYTMLFMSGMILEAVALNISNEYYVMVLKIYMLLVMLYFPKIISNIKKTIIAV